MSAGENSCVNYAGSFAFAIFIEFALKLQQINAAAFSARVSFENRSLIVA
jgi:hypothetical protein